MSISSNVYTFDLTAKAKQEFDDLMLALANLDWKLQLKLLIKASGLPANEMLLDRSAKIPSSSLAGRLGHQTIQDFVTSSANSQGIGYEWSRWEMLVQANRVKEYYTIYLDNPNEIWDQYNDVCKILGHIPADAFEYNEAKDKYLRQQNETLVNRHAQETVDLRKKISELVQRESSLDSQLGELRSEMDTLRRCHSDLIRDHEAKIKAAKEASDQAMEAALKSQREELNNRYTVEMAAKQHMLDIKEKELLSQYSSDNYVPASQYKAAISDLESERRHNSVLLERLEKSDNRIQSLLREGEENNKSLLMLNRTVSEQSTMIELLNAKLISSDSGMSHIQILDLQTKIDEMTLHAQKLENYILRFRAAAASERAKVAVAKEKIEKLSAQLEEAKLRLKARASRKSAFDVRATLAGLLNGFAQKLSSAH